LKIKIFMWFLKNGVVLTKDNLVKRRWKGCTKCGFRAQQETVQHLFFDCPMARLVWGCVAVAFGINKPTSVQHLFVLGLEVFRRSKGTLLWLEWQPYVGLFGSVGMIWFLTNHSLYLFCKWSLRVFSGSEVGLSFLRMMGETIWRLEAFCWSPSL
jgi:hypothetical protein